MTTDTSPSAIEITYEAAVPTYGGIDAADFMISRAGQANIECALYLALDARQLFEGRSGRLEDAQVQRLLQALAASYYSTVVAAGQEPPAIATLRAADIDAASVDEMLTAANIPLQAEG